MRARFRVVFSAMVLGWVVAVLLINCKRTSGDAPAIVAPPADGTTTAPRASGNATATAPASPTTPASTSEGTPTGLAPIVLHGTQGPKTIFAEVVRSDAAVEKGLMYRQHMAPSHGMLFLMGAPRVQAFWMRNTLIALDMLFLDETKTIVGIVENAEPLTETLRKVDAPSSYVLEVNAGWARANGVATGQRAQWEGVEALAK